MEERLTALFHGSSAATTAVLGSDELPGNAGAVIASNVRKGRQHISGY